MSPETTRSSRWPGLPALALALALAPEAGAADLQRWQVAPAGPCAEAPLREPCAGGACVSQAAPARSRFDPADVAADASRSDTPPPAIDSFQGPGSCADPSTPCGGASEPTKVAVHPTPGAPSPAGPPPTTLPTPGAPPPAPPAPPPPTVVESPGGPGTLPGDP